MRLKLIQAPSEQPLDLATAKLHARITENDQDALVSNWITEAIEQVEALTGRALVTQTWQLTADAFPLNRAALEIPKPPVQSISFVKYVDRNGAEQTLDGLQYELVTESETAYVVPAYGVNWPATREKFNSVTVQFICGYGDHAASVPQRVKSAMLLYIAHRYENREAVVDARGTLQELPNGFDAALSSLKVLRL